MTLEKAIAVFPDYLPPYQALAKYYLTEKNTEKAIEQFQTLIDKSPNSPFPHMMIGTILESKKEYDKAAEHYKKALEINPEFAPAANNLAYHLIERTDQADEALRLARIAKEKVPDDPYIMDTLGMAYYKKGLYGNAANEFLDSSLKLKNNPVVFYHLGLAYYKKGDKSQAIASLKKALKMDSSFKEADHAKKILAELNK